MRERSESGGEREALTKSHGNEWSVGEPGVSSSSMIAQLSLMSSWKRKGEKGGGGGERRRGGGERGGAREKGERRGGV